MTIGDDWIPSRLYFCGDIFLLCEVGNAVGRTAGNIIQEQYGELSNKSREFSVGRRNDPSNTEMLTRVNDLSAEWNQKRQVLGTNYDAYTYTWRIADHGGRAV
jgi:hypothetical protein